MIKIEQNKSALENNAIYNAIFKHIHHNIRAHSRSKKAYIDQWLRKYCVLGKICEKQGVREHVWFVPNIVGESREVVTPGKFCNFFPHLSLKTVFPALKLSQNCFT